MEEKNTNFVPLGADPVDPKPVTPNPLDIKVEDTKISTNSTPPLENPYTPPADPIKFTSPFAAPEQIKVDSSVKAPIESMSPIDSGSSNDILSAIKSDPNVNTDTKIKTESSFDSVNPIKIESGQESKKSNTVLFVFITLILVIAAAVVSGYFVYTWHLSQMEPIQKEKALLQTQVGNLKSQVDVLQKDKILLQADLDRISAETVQTKPTDPTTTPPVDGQPLAPTPAPATDPGTPAPPENPAPVNTSVNNPG